MISIHIGYAIAFLALAIASTFVIAYGIGRNGNLDDGPGDEDDDAPPDAAVSIDVFVDESVVYASAAVHAANGRAAKLSGIADLACLELERNGLADKAAELRARCRQICEAA